MAPIIPYSVQGAFFVLLLLLAILSAGCAMLTASKAQQLGTSHVN